MITQANIRIKRGDDCGQPVEIVDVDGKPFDLSSVKRIDLHAKSIGKTVLTRSTTDDAIKVTDKKSGRFLLHFPHDLTQAANWQRAEYDLQLVFVGDLIHTVLEGYLNLSGDVTALPDVGEPNGVIVTNPSIKVTITATELPTIDAGNALDNKSDPDLLTIYNLAKI